jgi:hypothetical protein
VSKKVQFVFDERSLEKLSDIREQGFMSVPDIMELARANQDVYTTAYRLGQDAGLKAANRLAGAIEDYLDGESQGNVTGLRQALAAFASAKPGVSNE